MDAPKILRTVAECLRKERTDEGFRNHDFAASDASECLRLICVALFKAADALESEEQNVK